jgi:hypothetical protein
MGVPPAKSHEKPSRCGASMISTCQEKKHFSLHSPEGFEARGYS